MVNSHEEIFIIRSSTFNVLFFAQCNQKSQESIQLSWLNAFFYFNTTIFLTRLICLLLCKPRAFNT